MALLPVNSSNVKGVGYEPATKTLTVAFKSGTYDYFDVPPEKWGAIEKAMAEDESVGSVISSQIVRDHKFNRQEGGGDGS